MRRVGAAPARHASQRLASTAVYAAGPVAILGVLWLQRAGLVADTPWWILTAVILAAGIGNFVGTAWLAARPDSVWRLQFRIGISVVTTGAVIYLAGWGSVLLISFALGSAELLRVIGPRSTRPNMVWNWLAILAGETAVALGWAPTMIDVGLGHAIAITGGICLTILTDVLGKSARTADDAQRQVRERGRRFEDLIAHATDIIGVVTASGTVVSVSPAVHAVLGYEPSEVEGQPVERFIGPTQAASTAEVLGAVLADKGRSTTIELQLRHRDGSPRRVVATLSSPPERWDDEVIMNLHDVTTQRELEDLLRHDARHDHLTGLLNRAAFSDASARAAAAAAHKDGSVGMLYIDLDGFKQINDSFGHETGDRVLVETAARLTGCLDPGAVLARLGGDEFAVLIEHADCHTQAAAIAARILEAVSAPIPHLRDDVRVGASIGIAIRGTDGIEISTLMREADEAMYHAKRNGRARWEFRDPTP